MTEPYRVVSDGGNSPLPVDGAPIRDFPFAQSLAADYSRVVAPARVHILRGEEHLGAYRHGELIELDAA
jgi:hypothetical protein